MWVYARKRSSCLPGRDCTLWGHELSSNAWELLGPNAEAGHDVVIDGGLLGTVAIEGFHLAAGETRGFLLVGSLGVGFSAVGDGERSCDLGYLETCSTYADAFAQVRRERVLY